jgi:signal transduction histidine kinase
MSDVVWAVDPKRDHLEDLVLRMRRFAEDLCAARGIALRFSAPEESHRRIDARVRRQVHLMFKESLNNAVKHSGCASIAAALSMDGRGLQLRVADDGSGFDPAAVSEGNGLVSMRRRAEMMGGSMQLTTSAGAGTELRFTIPA